VIGAITLSVLASFASADFTIAFFCGLLVVGIVVSSTFCMRVNKSCLYTAAVGAVACGIANFVNAATVSCIDESIENCNEADLRIFGSRAGFIWLGAAPLILYIPDHSAADSTTLSQEMKVNPNKHRIGAVTLTVLGSLLTKLPKLAFFFFLLVIGVVSCTCCIRVHKSFLYTSAVGAVACGIVNFTRAAIVSCIHETTENCNKAEVRILESLSGFIWLGAAALMLKIP
jgi:hypothetical protein